VAPSLTVAVAQNRWSGTDTSVGEIEGELAVLRRDTTDLRTSVMTHLAWVPPEWREAARETLAGLAERHPSRTILLFPEADVDRDALDATVSLERFALPELERHVCSEVVELRLLGARAEAPASVVLPLLLPDLPAFLRWRGRPPFATAVFSQLVDVVDRLIVDSSEWPDAPESFSELSPWFEKVAVSDIVWTRTIRWRHAIASLWPIEPRELHVRGPAPEAALLAGWLRSRLARDVALTTEPAEHVELVTLDGEEVRAREEQWTASELLSHELDRFSRDPVYEAATTAAV
jgi:glucose-6-phosphate dehydrogenase assembly protein OpcA